MLSIFRSKALDQAFGVTKYEEVLSEPYKEILLHKIKANSISYTKNKIITEKGNKLYTTGVSLTTFALLISILILLANKFIKIDNETTKVQVVNSHAVSPK